ncbi:hypothetical protein KSP39_PZI017171 [Platanthera zijinensis]|uniref:Uncharacterized protein n=1 Tax=Platanthera zijinensis TaxID=2320716 RepID=A0AAP0FZS2_9ASPA
MCLRHTGGAGHGEWLRSERTDGGDEVHPVLAVPQQPLQREPSPATATAASPGRPKLSATAGAAQDAEPSGARHRGAADQFVPSGSRLCSIRGCSPEFGKVGCSHSDGWVGSCFVELVKSW